MVDRIAARRIRSFLAALLPLGCVLVVCDVDTPPTAQPGAQPYEIGIACTDTGAGSNVSLAAGAEQGGGFGCNNDHFLFDPVTEATVEFEAVHGGSSVELACAYDAPRGGPNPFSCNGTFTYLVEWDSSGFASRVNPNSLRVALRSVALGGAPPGRFDVAATIDCPGYSPLELPADGTPIDFPDLLPAGSSHQGSCMVVVTFDGSVAAVGESLHTLTLTASANPITCRSNADCPAGLRCGPENCQLGEAGQACATSYVPVEPGLDLPPLGDCNETAPICTTFARCTDGAVGDGCRADVDCALGLHCTGILFGTCAP